MKKLLMSLVIGLFMFGMVGVSYALDFDFSDTFTYDNDIVLLDFTVGMDSTITIFSSSWDDGGFDPILAIWDSAENYVSEQDDGHNVGSTLSNGVLYSHGTWDSYYDVFLTAGSYTASIAQYDNFRNGGALSNGFRHDSEPAYTQAFASTPQPYFNGVWTDNDYRTGDWAFHILNVAEAQGPTNPVPEPSTILLVGTGLLGIIGFGRKRLNKKA